MAAKSRQRKGPDGALSSLNGAIEALDLAKGGSRITQAKAAFGSVGALLVMIRVSFLLVSSLNRWPIWYTGRSDQRSGLCRPRASLC